MPESAVISALVNAGGMGILAAVLYVLNREYLKAFREEMATERAINSANLKAERDQCHEDHLRMEKQIADSGKEVREFIAAIIEKRRGP